MKCTIPEISWHNREPVLSVDIHPISNDFYKLASGGGDNHILIWQMVLSKNGSVKQEVISDLTRHQKSVNTVRWSYSGQYLASADDDAHIIIWQLKNDNVPLLDGNTDDKETWVIFKVLRGHKEDIYDLCWSIDNMKLFTGSVDNTAILWDLTKGKIDHIISDHKGFVQGVAWDPKNQIVATISTDRICRIFDVTGKQVKTRIHKGKMPFPRNHILYDKESKYFHDDTFKSFFRRLQFTPDGSLLIVPSGHFQVDDCKKNVNSTLVFTMDNWTEPTALLPLDHQSSTVVRCCPLLFHQRDDGPEPLVKLPYRMIFAVGTDHDIILYDTQQTKPFARFHEIHYTRITDLTWSADGLLLIASSTDGFCSLITFEPEELGKVYIRAESNKEVDTLDVTKRIENVDKDENVDITNKNIKDDFKKEDKKRSSFIQQWVQNTPKKPKIDKKGINNVKELIHILDDSEEDENEHSEEIKEDINKLVLRKVATKKSVDRKLKRNDYKNNKEMNDTEEQLPKEIKEEINKLLPRRKTSDKGEVNKFVCSVAKPIEVRRKPREMNTTSGDKVEKKEIITPIPRRITPKKVGISFATPSLETKESEETETSTRRKFIEDTTKEILVNNDNISQSKTNGKKETGKPLDIINHDVIALEEDCQQNNIETGSVKGKGGKSKNKIEKLDHKTKKNKKQADKVFSVSNKEVINTTPKINKRIKHIADQGNSSSKEKEQTKIKIGSLIPKKTNKTPIQNNPLLNFLNKSIEKKSEVVEIISQKIDLTLDEDEARDGFGKEVIGKNNTKNEDLDVVSLEDYTEDFCLQLEDTQDNKVKKKNVCDPMEVEGIREGKQVNEVINISDESRSPKQKIIEENLVEKKPRRVQLITLASPKGKKKLVTEKSQK